MKNIKNSSSWISGGQRMINLQMQRNKERRDCSNGFVFEQPAYSSWNVSEELLRTHIKVLQNSHFKCCKISIHVSELLQHCGVTRLQFLVSIVRHSSRQSNSIKLSHALLVLSFDYFTKLYIMLSSQSHKPLALLTPSGQWVGL